jgi:hypothetical protein
MTTFGSDRTDGSEKAAGREDHQKTEPDERSSLESAGGEIAIARLDNVVKAPDLVLKLRADPADEKIAMWRHRPEDDRRPVFHLPVSLG